MNKLEIKLSQEEFRQARKAYVWHTNTRKWKSITFLVVIFLFNVVTALVDIAKGTPETPKNWAIVFVGFGTLFYLYWYLRAKAALRIHRVLKNYKELTTVTLENEGILLENDQKCTNWPWKNLAYHFETSEFLFIDSKVGTTLPLPKRAFSNASQMKHWKNKMNASIAKRRSYYSAVILSLITIAVLGLGGLYYWLRYSEFMQIDRCLNRGGCWDYSAKQCRLEESDAQELCDMSKQRGR